MADIFVLIDVVYLQDRNYATGALSKELIHLAKMTKKNRRMTQMGGPRLRRRSAIGSPITGHFVRFPVQVLFASLAGCQIDKTFLFKRLATCPSVSFAGADSEPGLLVNNPGWQSGYLAQ